VYDRGLTLDPSPGPDGRPLTGHGENLVLEPYQYAWLVNGPGSPAR
jgi:hypothetical protein